MRYLLVNPNGPLRAYEGVRPFRAIVVIEALVDAEWQYQMSKWLVESGCLYMLAWGSGCSSWDDSVDYANLETYSYGDIPDDKFVMTTWHENEPLSEVFEFAKHHAQPMSDGIELKETVVFHISTIDRKQEYESLFAAA